MNKLTEKNIGSADRIIRLLLGIILISIAAMSANLVMMLLGLFTVYEAVSSWCILYAFIGKNTCPLKKKKNIIHLIFLNGLIILAAAICINTATQAVGLTTWYEFLNDVFTKGLIPSLKSIDPISSIFLFFLYPFALGYISYLFLMRFLSK